MADFGAQARLLAGGTDLLVDLKINRFEAEHVVSLNRIPGLSGVSAGAGGVRIGALTTVADLAASPIVGERFPAILDATKDMGGPQIRNMATVGGNIANAVPSADLPPALIALRARVTLWSRGGERVIPLEDFFLGPRRTVRRVHEILTEIFVPDPPARCGAAYQRFSLREANALAVAGVAASLKLGGEGLVEEARVCLCAVAPTPKLVPEAEKLLLGAALDDASLGRAAAAAMNACEPISDVRGSAEFRRELVGVLTRRALIAARERA
jgi:carbon-monoxide dehydrogenase medium subunit